MSLLWHRRLLVLACFIIVGGSVSASLGFAFYLHGPRYRSLKASELGRATGMQASIDRVQPLSFHSRQFNGVRLRIPEDGTEIFHCDRARWIDDRSAAADGSSLEIEDGWLLLGTHRWGIADYEKVLHSGFGHDFHSLGLGRVRFNDVDLEWMHERFRLMFGGAVGDVLFEPGQKARAKITACTLNGESLAEPVQVAAQLTTGSQLVVHEVVLTVPRLPLGSLGLESLVQGEITQGRFQGRITLRESDIGLSIEAAGALDDAFLPELTGSIVGGPFSGRADLTVDRLHLVNDILDSLRFHGHLTDLKVNELAPFLDSVDLPGQLELRVHQADISGDRINYLSAGGRAVDVALEPLTRQLGYGLITGRLRMNIRDLTVVDDQLIAADAEIMAEPAPGEVGTIDRELVKYVSTEWLGMDVSAVLPAKIPYSKLGVRLVLNHGRLRLHGTHGTDNKTLLTVKVFNRDLAVLNEPSQTFEVPDLIALLRARASEQSPADLRRWWESQHTPPP